MRRLFFSALLVWASAPLQAHPLAPALLELRASATGIHLVTWRVASRQRGGIAPMPSLPGHCRALEPMQLRPEGPATAAAHWRVDCGTTGLAGSRIAIEGLAETGINAIVRVIEADGSTHQALLDGSRQTWSVPTAEEASWLFGRYLGLGVEHLLLGPDHLLFVIGLLLLITGLRRLVLTLTAFTLGHSLTLALASLELIAVNSALMELGIALSLVLVAREILAPRMALIRRWPGASATGFGLLHGLGFAGALREVGLPHGEIPQALLAFNIGIELGQLLVVAAALLILALSRQHPPVHGLALPATGRLAAAYSIGTLACFWCLERAGSVSLGLPF